MNDDTISSKQIRFAVPYLPKVARSLLNKGKNYDALLLQVLKYDALTEEDQYFPTNKELQAVLKLSPGQLRTQLEAIYQDFLATMSDRNTAFNFGDILVEFYVRGIYTRSVTFYAKINHLPGVGENLDPPFLRPIFQFNTFNVRSVRHSFENDNQYISISVKEGGFNLFEHLELEQAKSENRYDWKTDSITEPAARPQSYSSVKTNRRFGGSHW
jgi:hypothetical protein